MSIVLISKYDSSLVKAMTKILKEDVLCINEDNLYLCTQEKILQGIQLFQDEKPQIDINKVRIAIIAAYPLVDRWINPDQSFSTTIGMMLDYTCKLIWLFLSKSPKLALLETGAPHHLFTFCLDVALDYTKVKTFYLYGNSIDGRCLVFEGKNKNRVYNCTKYKANTIIDTYISGVLRTKNFVPQDSLNSLAPRMHRSLLYTLYRHLIDSTLRNLLQWKRTGFKTHKFQSVALHWPRIGMANLYSSLRKQIAYLKKIKLVDSKIVNTISAEDVVYVGHMVPEATSFPESINFPDEIDVLLDLKYRFPNSGIFYREHPAINIFNEFNHIHLQGLYKNNEFLEFLKCNDIGLIPPTEHISKIREKGCLFATKTGRVAIENSILSLQTIVYGNPFYGNDLPGCIHISNIPKNIEVSRLKSIIEKKGQNILKIRKHLIKHFSGSIINPGISLSVEDIDIEKYNLQLIQVINKLLNRPFKSRKNSND